MHNSYGSLTESGGSEMAGEASCLLLAQLTTCIPSLVPKSRARHKVHGVRKYTPPTGES